MPVQRIAALLIVLATTTSLVVGEPPRAMAAVPDDPVAQTMKAMRVLSTLLIDEQRQGGGFPLADGQLHRVKDALGSENCARAARPCRDGWGHPIWYRAIGAAHQLISYGADGTADQVYENLNLYNGRFRTVVDTPDPRNDLVLIDGRFVKRPFGSRGREFETINAINAIFIGSASYAVDNNRYPGDAAEFRPVSELAAELAPTYIHDVPLNDGWGHPLLYASRPGAFILASYGENGVPETAYYTDLPCNLQALGGETTIEEGGDILQVCGVFASWPRGTEP